MPALQGYVLLGHAALPHHNQNCPPHFPGCLLLHLGVLNTAESPSSVQTGTLRVVTQSSGFPRTTSGLLSSPSTGKPSRHPYFYELKPGSSSQPGIFFSILPGLSLLGIPWPEELCPQSRSLCFGSPETTPDLS